MADMRVFPTGLGGSIGAPPSKSAAHRALICAALTQGHSRVFPLADSEDMAATTQVLQAMGAQIIRKADTADVTGGDYACSPVTLDCGESGSTLRFLLPVAAALGLDATFTGRGRLPQRPIDALAEQMRTHGVTFSDAHMPFSICGRLTGGHFPLPGDVSSQFISGLLLALPLLSEDSEIVLTTPLESSGYVDMTLCALKQSGIHIESLPTGWRIAGGQRYMPGDRTVEGDYSNAAFWLCAGAICGEVTVTGLDPHSVQGDRAIVEIIRQFGGDITVDGSTVISRPAALRGCRVDAAPIPDLVPIIAVMATCAEGETEIYNAARLRIKESDRLATVSAMLRAIGGNVEEYPDRLIVRASTLSGGTVDGANDHRIVMAAAIAAQRCHAPVDILGAQAVNKSYPDFFEKLASLGGQSNGV